MKSETSIKSTRRIACELCFLALAVLLEVSFFSEISAFLNSLIQRAGFDGGFSLFIATIYFYAPIILAPFVLLSLRYDTFLSRIAVISPAEGLIRNLFLINVGAALFCSFFWVIKARGILEAVRYEFVNFNFILLGAVILLSYAAANSNLKSTKNLANGLKYSFVICFCYVFYHWFGLDDGCVTTGADPILAEVAKQTVTPTL